MIRYAIWAFCGALPLAASAGPVQYTGTLREAVLVEFVNDTGVNTVLDEQRNTNPQGPWEGLVGRPGGGYGFVSSVIGEDFLTFDVGGGQERIDGDPRGPIVLWGYGYFQVDFILTQAVTPRYVGRSSHPWLLPSLSRFAPDFQAWDLGENTVLPELTPGTYRFTCGHDFGWSVGTLYLPAPGSWTALMMLALAVRRRR